VVVVVSFIPSWVYFVLIDPFVWMLIFISCIPVMLLYAFDDGCNYGGCVGVDVGYAVICYLYAVVVVGVRCLLVLLLLLLTVADDGVGVVIVVVVVCDITVCRCWCCGLCYFRRWLTCNGNNDKHTRQHTSSQTRQHTNSCMFAVGVGVITHMYTCVVIAVVIYVDVDVCVGAHTNVTNNITNNTTTNTQHK